MNIIDGRAVSLNIKNNLRIKMSKLNAEGITVGLAMIIVGNDPASQVYVKNKINACKEVGIKSYHYELPENTSEDYIINLIKELNNNKEVYGILIQLPLPKHLDEKLILSTIDPKKDVDGFSSYQMGKLLLGEKGIKSCTPNGIMELLHAYNIKIEGKNAVVIGRSNIVGKPMAIMLLKENATVTICHSKTENLGSITKKADIIVCAVGIAKFLTQDMVGEGAVVIDVGISRVDGKLFGDVDFENVAEKCSYITPVPGGVGPMTVTMLIKNTVEAVDNNA